MPSAGYKTFKKRWEDLTDETRKEEISRVVTHYRNMKLMASSMYNEVVYQYLDMAKGGSGGPLGFVPNADDLENLIDNLMPVQQNWTIRSYNYPGYPDDFFARVLANLGEEYEFNAAV